MRVRLSNRPDPFWPLRRIPTARYAIVYVLACAILIGSGTCQAEEDLAAPTADPPITAEILRERLEAIDDAQDLTDDLRKTAKTCYEQAIPLLEVENGLRTQGAMFDTMATSAEKKLNDVRAALAKKTPSANLDRYDDTSLADLEKQLAQDIEAQREAKDVFAALANEPDRRRQRRAEIPTLRDTARKQLESLEEQLALPAAKDDPALVVLAKRSLLLAKRQKTEQDILVWDRELAAYGATAQLLPLERDLAARRVAKTTAATDQLRATVHRQREHLAKEAEESARRDLAQALPAFRPLAARNQTLAEEGRQAVERTETVVKLLKQRKHEAAQLRQSADRTREKVEQVGASDAMGLLLRRQRSSLPDVEHFRRDRQKWEREIRTTQLRLIDLSDERASLAVLTSHIDSTLRAMRDVPEDMTQADLETAVRGLFERRKTYLDVLLRNDNRYFDALVELHAVDGQLINAICDYRDFIDARVLWIRSAGVLGIGDLSSLRESIAWFTQPAHWAEVGRHLETDARRFPLLTGLVLCLFVFLFWCRRWLPRRIVALSDRAARKDCTSFRLTIEVVLETLLLASVWSALLVFLGWRLQSGDASEFCWVVGAGMHRTAMFLLPFAIFRQLCLPHGLADEHFDWPRNACRLFNRHLAWFILVSAPLVFISAVLRLHAAEAWQESTGRISVILVLLALASLNHLLLRTHSPMMQRLSQTDPEGWLYRLRYGWYGLGVLAPASLAVLAAMGFYYTAFQLGVCLIHTGWVVLIVFILSALLLRWLRMSRRKLAFSKADRDPDATPPSAVAGPAGPIARRATTIDLDSIDQQSRRLVKAISLTTAAVGVWWVWRDMIPALGILDDITLWHTTRAGVEEAVTLTHALWALVAIGLTILSVRNLPGLLELLILQRLPIDASVRYATVTILRYLLTVVGIIVACRLVGIRWSEVQWLVAAASVGLGFGLQEILANFVSGLILLTERPIRVGDIVTVDGVTGVVSTIRMRATVVTNWDRQEFIIPNKDLITGRVLNWTLSNTVNRVVVNVRVPRDANAERVRELLLKVAHDHPDILDEPAPLANLEEFDDGCLLFVLRCYLPDLKNRLGTKHALHTAIQRTLHENGVEIAVPHRDIVIHATDATTDRPDASAPSS